MFKRIPGTKDILPQEVLQWQHLEALSRTIFSIYNYQEIRPPLLEEAILFNRSLGDSTEIVQKQMFLIQNKEDQYALRPEATASVVRAYIENNIYKTSQFAKFYYMGPMFRFERPQKGRLRQFHHIGAEAIGALDADLDIEVVSLADSLLKAYAIEGYTIKLNSLGCSDDKLRLTQLLRSALQDKLNAFCDDCKRRFEGNILRILDCKNPSCVEATRELDIGDRHLCQECKAHFSRVKLGLEGLNISVSISPHLVRGLDYYTGTVFEITHPDLGAQDALGAGGRYNNLVKELGGPDVGAMGFAFGVERLLLVKGPESQRASLCAYLIALGEEAKIKCAGLLSELRKSGIACDMDYEGKSLKGAMRKADDLKAKYAVIIGDNELKKNVAMVKDMTSGEQKEVALGILTREFSC